MKHADAVARMGEHLDVADLYLLTRLHYPSKDALHVSVVEWWERMLLESDSFQYAQIMHDHAMVFVS